MKHEDTEDRYCDDDCCAASGNTCTPLRPDAFEMSDDDKIQSIENDFRHIMHTLGLDLTDDSLRNTPGSTPKRSPACHPLKTNTATGRCWSKRT